MLSLSNLTKITAKSKKRVGRGYGSNVGGHTTTRGNKGFKARNKVPLTFDGTKIKKSWLKRLPFLRGKGRFVSSSGATVITVGQLKKFSDKGKINRVILVKKGFLKKDSSEQVKVLGQGEINVSLAVDLPCSKKAAEKIIAAGGTVKK